MANRLVPYSQDTNKWIDHYVSLALKQKRTKPLQKILKETTIRPKLVLPTAQMVAQAKAEMKYEREDQSAFEPIKVSPKFNSISPKKSVEPTTYQSITQPSRKRHREVPIQKEKAKKLRSANTVKQRKQSLRDIFSES